MSDKECLINLVLSKILYCEYIQGYNKPEDPHRILYHNYLDEIKESYPYVVERLAEAELEKESSEKIIQIYNKWIQEIATKVEFKYFDINNFRNDVEGLIAVLYKDYNFNIAKARLEIQLLERELFKNFSSEMI